MDFQVVNHKDILFKDILRAIAIKSVAWPYPIESQVKWIIENMRSEDKHVFLTDDGKDEAYMTLSPVEGHINGELVSFYGVGCVCSSNPGKGYGKLLMESVNDYLNYNQCRGLLFCKKNLISFYGRYNWMLVQPDKVNLSSPHEGIYTMVYNCDMVHELRYDDRLF